MTDVVPLRDEPADGPVPAPASVDGDTMSGAGARPPGRVIGTLAGRWSLAIVGLGIFVLGVHALSIPWPPCPLRWSTGLPCPLCGMTHLAIALVTGQFGLVVRNDPAGLVLAAALFVGVATQAVAELTRRAGGPRYMTSRSVGYGLLAVLGAHWVTTIITGGMLTA